MVKVKEGRYYINEEGEVIGPMINFLEKTPSFIVRRGDGMSYKSNGVGNYGASNLVKKIPKSWTIWDGTGDSPRGKVDVMLRNGEKIKADHEIDAVHFEWSHNNQKIKYYRQIIAYKCK